MVLRKVYLPAESRKPAFPSRNRLQEERKRPLPPSLPHDWLPLPVLLPVPALLQRPGRILAPALGDARQPFAPRLYLQALIELAADGLGLNGCTPPGSFACAFRNRTRRLRSVA